MRSQRASTLPTAALAASAFLLAVHALRTTLDPDLVARAWPSTAICTIMLILAPRRHTRVLVGLVVAVFLGACLVSGRGVLFGVGFAIANAVEALLVLRWLTRFEAKRPQLRSWVDYRRWLLGISVASAVAAAITTLTIGIGGGHDLWRSMTWITITHLAAQTVCLPLFMRHPVHQVRVSAVEVGSHVILLVLGGLACLEAERSEPVAFLLLPLLMWAAARFSARWANLELVTVALGMAALNNVGRGPFTGVSGHSSVLAIAASSQTFVAVCAITAMAFSVAMAHLRDSLRRIRENELQLGQLLDSASGTAFIATDLDGLITWFSPGAELLLGYTSEEVVGRITPVPFHESRELLARARELGSAPDYDAVTQAVARGNEQDTRDWTYVRRDGSRLTVSLSVTADRAR